jgi:stalled ribosome rescue protein Dom34
MQKQVGLWIDHRKAVIVEIENKTVVTREIESNMEKHIRFSSNLQSNAANKSQGSTEEDTRDRKFGNHLEKFYEIIVSNIRDADSIWIIGPGEAKIELQNYMKSHALGDCIVGVETTDKLTNNQIASKVRNYFNVKKTDASYE